MSSSSELPPLSTGLRVLILLLVLHLLLLCTQTWAVWDYDLMASFKLQEPRSMADEAVVQSNRAVGLADTIIMIPLSLMAIVGLSSKQFYGVVTSWMLLGIALYWPVVYVMSRITYASGDIEHVPLGVQDISVCSVVFLFGCWGSWLLCRSPELLLWWKKDFPEETTKEILKDLVGEQTPLIGEPIEC